MVSQMAGEALMAIVVFHGALILALVLASIQGKYVI